jgi:hypothetical protein
MKYKLISFDVTKALEKSVGDRVEGIALNNSAAKEQLRLAGIPLLSRGIDGPVDLGALKSYFQAEIKLDVIEVAKKMSLNPKLSAWKDGDGIHIRVGNGFSDEDSLAFFAALYEKEKELISIIEFGGSQITDVGLEPLGGLRNLLLLDLCTTEISNTGLQYLSGLPSLQVLHLRRTKIISNGLLALMPIKTLRRLDIRETFTSLTSIKERLKVAIPGLEIIES